MVSGCLLVNLIVFQGHDTTAAGITWALYLLARHPTMQQKAREEVDNFFGERCMNNVKFNLCRGFGERCKRSVRSTKEP